MELQIHVEEILLRVPERAHLAYTNLLTHHESRYDDLTGWTRAYLTQAELAQEMACSVRTAERALRDLREYGIARVLAWPGSRTETQVRVADVPIASPFGPERQAQQARPRHALVEEAIGRLLRHNRQLEREAGEQGN
ncbi:helix-turn-helix domain-containing protein [Streptomyces roseifaciens]